MHLITETEREELMIFLLNKLKFIDKYSTSQGRKELGNMIRRISGPQVQGIVRLMRQFHVGNKEGKEFKFSLNTLTPAQ